MALTAALVDRFGDGNRTIVGIFSLTFATNYPAGGEALDLRPLIGWTNKDPYDVNFLQDGSAGVKLSYNRTTRKVQVFIEQAVGTNTALGEHTAAAYNATLTADTNIRMVCKFKK